MNLLPMPRELSSNDGVYTLTNAMLTLVGAHTQAMWFAAQRLKTTLVQLGVDVRVSSSASGAAGNVMLVVDPERVQHAQGYVLDITPSGVTLAGNDAPGVFYGVCTLLQLIALESGPTIRLPYLHIADWPDYPHRGVMLDISRDKVPTLDTLLAQIDQLAGWKINQVQLYTEHTFAYRDHKQVWANASPYTAEDIQQIDLFCRARHVELVPNQNSFGHWHRWLRHAEYLQYAEVQDPNYHNGWIRSPFSLNPTEPRSVDLLSSLYDELLPNFSSSQFNVGCDETFDLGLGRSREYVEEMGKGRVYLEFLQKIHALTQTHGRTMQFWGDIIMNHPELIPLLPRDGSMIALEWGYEAAHPFDDHCAKFAAAGVPFYVCPGTSSWNSLVGRTQNMLGNLRNAAEAGLKHGAIGFLNTDWGDHGHWQPLPVSDAGFAYGAALSWAVQANADIDLATALSTHCYADPSGVMGILALELGRNPELLPAIHNANPIVRVMYARPLFEKEPRDVAVGMKLTAPLLRAARKHIDRALKPLAKHTMQRPDAALIAREFALAGALLQLGADHALMALGKGLDQKTFDAQRKRVLVEYKKVWLLRNRPGGLADSAKRIAAM